MVRLYNYIEGKNKNKYTIFSIASLPSEPPGSVITSFPSLRHVIVGSGEPTERLISNNFNFSITAFPYLYRWTYLSQHISRSHCYPQWPPCPCWSDNPIYRVELQHGKKNIYTCVLKRIDCKFILINFNGFDFDWIRKHRVFMIMGGPFNWRFIPIYAIDSMWDSSRLASSSTLATCISFGLANGMSLLYGTAIRKTPSVH